MEELLEQIILKALQLEVTDLHFKSTTQATIYMRLKNQIVPFQKMSSEKYNRLITYLQYKAQLDYNCLSKPQTGSFQMEINGSIFYFRLSYIPSNSDIHLVLRFLNHLQKVDFEELTSENDIIGEFRNVLNKESGLVVVCGPTGSGKSTTLHCFLEEINANQQKNIVTIEDPVEIYLPGIIQIQVNESNGMTFDIILEQVLRHDPDVIMIGELRNEYSASIALKLSLTGHLVLTTLHATDGQAAIKRLLNLNISKEDLGQILVAIITQRLFYHVKTSEPFVVFERLYQKDIQQLLESQSTTYITLNQEIHRFYRMGWLGLNEFKKYN